MTGQGLTFSPAFELANFAELRRERLEEVKGLPRDRRDAVLLGTEVRVVVVVVRLPNMVRSGLEGVVGRGRKQPEDEFISFYKSLRAKNCVNVSTPIRGFFGVWYMT